MQCSGCGQIFRPQPCAASESPEPANAAGPSKTMRVRRAEAEGAPSSAARKKSAPVAPKTQRVRRSEAESEAPSTARKRPVPATSSTIPWSCPGCRASLRVKDTSPAKARKIQCPKCNKVSVVNPSVSNPKSAPPSARKQTAPAHPPAPKTMRVRRSEVESEPSTPSAKENPTSPTSVTHGRCPGCEQKFRASGSLPPSLKCPRCGKVFSSRGFVSQATQPTRLNAADAIRPNVSKVLSNAPARKSTTALKPPPAEKRTSERAPRAAQKSVPVNVRSKTSAPEPARKRVPIPVKQPAPSRQTEATQRVPPTPRVKSRPTDHWSLPPATTKPGPAFPRGSASAQKSETRLIVLGLLGCLLLGLIVGAVWLIIRQGPTSSRVLSPVTGKVTFEDGSPLTEGLVFFFRADVPGASSPKQRVVVPRGFIQLDGSYQMGTLKDDDGVAVGTYKVVVAPARPIDPSNPSQGGPLFKASYSRFTETPLEYTVKQGQNQYPIVLQR